MVPNPIYDGPVYESVRTQFDSLTSTTLKDVGMADNSVCNSQPGSPTTVSDNSVRYVDPPVAAAVQMSKIRSNSFVTSIPLPSSARSDDPQSAPRATSISIPTTKKNGKERNKLHLTLTLTGNDLNITAEPQMDQNENNPTVVTGVANQVVKADVDDNYTTMSPAGVLLPYSQKRVLCELSPEDIAQKYKE